MNTGNLRKAFVERAIPGVLALLLNSAYVVVDGLFVARLIGRDALAAVTVAVPVMEILIALAMLISVGAGVLISQRQGQGDVRQARAAFNTSFVMLAVFSVCVAAVGWLFARSVGRQMGGTEAILPMVEAYLRYLFAFSPFLMFSFGLGTWARNDGQPRLALVSMGVGAVVNIVLDYAFIVWCGWGIGGAALATGLGPVVGCAILLPHFLRRRGTLYFEKIRIRGKEIRAILLGGIPSFLMEFSLGLTTLCVNIAISHRLGALGLAAYGVVAYIALLALTAYLGMAEGTQPLISFYDGKGDAGAVGYLVKLSLRVCLVSGTAFYALAFVCARQASMLFGGSDVALVSLAVQAIRLYFPTIFAAGMNIQLSSSLQSVGCWQRSAVISALRSFALLSVLLWLLPLALGDTGIWLAVPVAELLTLPVAWWLYRHARKANGSQPIRVSARFRNRASAG